MSLPKTTRSATLTLQALVTGSVSDGLTGGVPRGALTVRLIDRDTEEDYPLAGRVLPDGTFAFYGAPETAFLGIAEQAYRLRLEASAPSYGPASFELDLGPAAGQPAPVTRAMPSGDARVRLFTGGGLPRTEIRLTLDRNPVRLRGRVSVSDSPGEGVSGATVRLNPPAGPSATTDADGYFTFPAPLPVALTVEIEVSAADFENAQLRFEPDYTRLLNFLVVNLKRS
jgi:hypothetical protein